jgi:hypothetical protein
MLGQPLPDLPNGLIADEFCEIEIEIEIDSKSTVA